MSQTRLELIMDMLEKDPNDPFLLYAVALEYKKIGNFVVAIKQLENLIKSHPQYLGTYYLLGKLYEESDEVAKAIEIYKKGKIIATSIGDHKILGELNEALLLLEEDD